MTLKDATIEYENAQTEKAFSRLAQINTYMRRNLGAPFIGNGLRNAVRAQTEAKICCAWGLGGSTLNEGDLDDVLAQVHSKDYSLQKRYTNKPGVPEVRREFIRAEIEFYQAISSQEGSASSYGDACRFYFGQRSTLITALGCIDAAQKGYLEAMAQANKSLAKRNVPQDGLRVGQERREQLLIDVFGPE